MEERDLYQSKQALKTEEGLLDEAQILTTVFKVRKLSLKSNDKDQKKDLGDFVTEMHLTAFSIKEAFIAKELERAQRKIFRLIKLARIAQVMCLIYEDFLMSSFEHCKHWKCFARFKTQRSRGQTQKGINELKFPIIENIFEHFTMNSGPQKPEKTKQKKTVRFDIS